MLRKIRSMAKGRNDEWMVSNDDVRGSRMNREIAKASKRAEEIGARIKPIERSG